MHRYLRLAGSVLAIAALAVLTIVLVLIVRGEQAKPQPISPALQSPIATPTPVAPAPIPTLAPTAIERCAFRASAASPVAGPSLDSYHFSEPQVVLTHTSAIGIAGWLPDGQRLLITRLIPPALTSEYVDTVDVTTGKLVSYGERHSFAAKPIWLASKHSVAMTDLVNQDIVLRINRQGGVPGVEPIPGLMSPYLAATSDGRRLAFLSKEADLWPQMFDTSLSQRQMLPFALPWISPAELLTLGQQDGPIPYQAAWLADGNRTAFYNDTGLYVVDLVASHICEIDLGTRMDGKRWAVDVQWSPNGRFLAALTTVGDPVVRFVDLTVIDMHTGETRLIKLGLQYLAAFSWDLDSHHLVVLAEAERSSRANQYDLYLVDIVTGDSRPVLQGYPLMFAGAYGIAWSPMGKAVAVACPGVDSTSGAISEGRLCIIRVEVKQ